MQKKIGVSGLKGSFSEEAAMIFLDKHKIKGELHYLIDMEGVLRALRWHQIDLGIFPVVNSIGGLVETAFKAMGKYNFELLDELPFLVNQCLMAQIGLEEDDIMQIASHPQALKQCERYLADNFGNLPLLEWSDTASAAEALSLGILPYHAAVIGSKRAAEIYNLNVLSENIQDRSPNITTFILCKNLSRLQGTEIEELRESIDLIDEEIFELLVDRMSASKLIGINKIKKSKAVEDEQREKDLREEYAQKAIERGLHPNFINAYLDAVFAESKRIQGFLR